MRGLPVEGHAGGPYRTEDAMDEYLIGLAIGTKVVLGLVVLVALAVFVIGLGYFLRDQG